MASESQHVYDTDERNRDLGRGEGGLGGEGGMAAGAVRGATGGIVTLVRGTEEVLSEVVRASGRVATTTAEEVLGVIGTVLGGVTDTASAVFQGRRMPTGRERERQRQHASEHTGQRHTGDNIEGSI